MIDWCTVYRIWGANCKHVGSMMSSCPPVAPPRPRPQCEAVTASAPCAEFYYGAPNCSVFCRPDDSCLGHYMCSANGSKVLYALQIVQEFVTFGFEVSKNFRIFAQKRLKFVQIRLAILDTVRSMTIVIPLLAYYYVILSRFSL